MTRRDLRRAGRVTTAGLIVTMAATTGALGRTAADAGSRDADDSRLLGDVATQVERVLADELAGSGVPGGAVAVVSGHKVDVIGSGSAGDGRAVEAGTQFVIGSTSKSVTALAVMQLVDAGRVDLDTAVRDYVPELRLADGEPIEDITVRHLLQQTSGLDDLAGGPLLASAADGTPLEAVAELEDAELASIPGMAWRYANVNYVLAGLVVERASGRSYSEYVQQEIFGPLGMASSSAANDATGNDLLGHGHQFWFGVPIGTEPTRREATMAAGYLISTAADLGRYLSLYLTGGVGPDGTRIVSAAGVRTLLTAGPEAHLGSWAQGQESRYAMGWFVGGPWGDDAAFHPGNTPDTTTMLALFPDRGVAVGAVVNAGNELPVPGNPFIADRITRNVVHAAVDQPGQELPSLRGFYVTFDGIVLLLLVAAAWGVIRARRTVTVPTRQHRARRWTGVLVRALIIGLLVLTPMASYGWRGLWTWAPDLAAAIAAAAVLLTAVTVLRAIGLLRTTAGTHPAPADAATEATTTAEGAPYHVSP